MTTAFTPFASLIGGALIGAAALIFLLGAGRIAGISGILAGLLPPPERDGASATRLAFLAGLIIAPPAIVAITRAAPPIPISQPLWIFAVAGLLVGFGTVLGRGCTSGHGVCGLARLSVRSLAATITFMAVAAAVVYVRRHVLGA